METRPEPKRLWAMQKATTEGASIASLDRSILATAIQKGHFLSLDLSFVGYNAPISPSGVRQRPSSLNLSSLNEPWTSTEATKCEIGHEGLGLLSRACLPLTMAAAPAHGTPAEGPSQRGDSLYKRRFDSRTKSLSANDKKSSATPPSRMAA